MATQPNARALHIYKCGVVFTYVSLSYYVSVHIQMWVHIYKCSLTFINMRNGVLLRQMAPHINVVLTLEWYCVPVSKSGTLVIGINKFY